MHEFQQKWQHRRLRHETFCTALPIHLRVQSMVGRALSRTQSALSCSVCECIQHMNILPYVHILVQGCNASATDEIEKNLGVIVGVGVAFGIFQVRPHSHTHHTHYTHTTHTTHLASLGTQASPVSRVHML